MRERTRRLYARTVQDYFSAIGMNDDSIEPRYFSALKVQNYLWAELCRPCFNVERPRKNTFCAIRYLKANVFLDVSHELDAPILESILPIVVYDNKHFLYREQNGRKHVRPFVESLPFRHHRRNLFVIRNLSVTSVAVTIACTDAVIRPIKSGLEVTRNTRTVPMKPRESLVVILSDVVDNSPVTFNSVEGGLLIFYVGEAIM